MDHYVYVVVAIMKTASVSRFDIRVQQRHIVTNLLPPNRNSVFAWIARFFNERVLC